MAIIDDPGGAFLERAEEAGGAGSLGIDGLDLTSLRDKTFSRDIAGAITAASCTRTVEGASTLVLTIEDKDLAFLRASIVDLDADGQLDPLVVTLDLLRWRLVKQEVDWSASASEVKLTFEEEAVTLLRAHNAPLAASRANITRAGFAHRLVREVKAYPLGWCSPEENFGQAIARPKTQTSRDAQRKPGFADGVTLKIKAAPADASQLREIETVLTVCDEENAKGAARKAIILAGIGESQFRKSATQPKTKAHGVFQLLPATERSTGLDSQDTEGTARHFLRTGYYKYGGAIQIARENAGWSAGTITTAVEGSYDPPQKGAAYYDQFGDEADKIIAAWTGTADGSSSSSSDTRTTVKPYLFRRGLPGKRETSWDCLQRLAAEVGWRCFCVANIIYFISEEQLFMSRARAEIGVDTPGVNSLKSDQDSGKNADHVTLNVDAGMWSFPPGSIIALRDLGTLTGRWLVETIDRPNLFDPATEITLSKPIARKREPAADTIQVRRDSKHDTDPENEQNGGTGNGPATDARGVKASSTASSRLREWRNPDGSTKWVCEWMFPQLEYAKGHGWSGVITEGWRSRTTEEVYWDRYGHDTGRAARPGTSNHGWTIYPRGAIDTADPAGLQRALRGYQPSRHSDPPAMKGNGVALPRDIVHFSHDGT